MKRGTAQWVRKAEADFRLADQVIRSGEPFHDSVCFHCQQSAEKYLKALLVELALPVPRTHDLDRLLTDVVVHHPTLSSIRRGALFLEQFAVETRYPGFNATKRQASSALRWASRLRLAVRSVLALP